MLGEGDAGVDVDPLDPGLEVGGALFGFAGEDGGGVTQLLEVGEMPLLYEFGHQTGAQFVEFQKNDGSVFHFGPLVG